MQFDQLPKEEGKGLYLLTFEVDELDIIAAAFREHVYNTVVANPGSVENFDMKVAEWDSHEEARSMRVHNYEDVIEMLDEFHERTREAMSAIPDISGVPPFQNEAIPERYQLGQDAKALAEQAREVIKRYFVPTETEILGETANMDERLRNFLSGESSDK